MPTDWIHRLSGDGAGLCEKIVVDQQWVHPIGAIPLDEAALSERRSWLTTQWCAAGTKAGGVGLVGGSGPIVLLTAAVLKGMGGTTIPRQDMETDGGWRRVRLGTSQGTGKRR